MAKATSTAWEVRRRRWVRVVQENIAARDAGRGIALGPSRTPLRAPEPGPISGRRLKVVVCSPHPDDEALVGALPLRLRRECGATVANCAITLGSDPGQRARRLGELEASCGVLGFALVVAHPPWGFDQVNLANRQKHPAAWAAKVRVLSETLEQQAPDVVFAPHAEDFNSTHIGTHYLVVEALGDYLERTGRSALPLIETEFWQPNAGADLLVGLAAEDEAILLMAAAEHGGEVRRNPYHLWHPSRMLANVGRGAEVVGGQGSAAPDFPLGELYRLVFVAGRELVPARPRGRVIGPDSKIHWPALLRSFRPAALA